MLVRKVAKDAANRMQICPCRAFGIFISTTSPRTSSVCRPSSGRLAYSSAVNSCVAVAIINPLGRTVGTLPDPRPARQAQPPLPTAPRRVAITPMTEREFATDVVRRLRAAGHQLLWAGGCVRDQLLGREPHDYDVATDATPEQVQELFRRTVAGRRQLRRRRGARPARRRAQVQVATFRTDGAYSDGRRPTRSSSPRPRRTPAAATSPSTACSSTRSASEVIDYVGGQDDLRAGVLRAIGDPARGSPRTSCACCGRCDSRRGSA